MINIDDFVNSQYISTAKDLVDSGVIHLRQKVDFINRITGITISSVGKKDIADIRKLIKPHKIESYYVYMVSDNEFVKIGMTTNIRSRITTMKVHNPRELSLLWIERVGNNKEDAVIAESIMHEKFKADHIHGEWFDKSAIDNFLNKLEK